MSEDAAVLLADFVSSLDNLPSEVCHILEEISHKEGRVSDLRSRATQRDQAIQKHSRPATQGGQGLLVANPKEDSSIKKIKLDFESAELATREKVALSERGVNLLSRHLNRLQTQLDLLTSTAPPLPTLPSFAPTAQAAAPAAAHYASQPAYGATPGGPGAYNAYGTPGYGAGQGTPGSLQRKASGTPGPLAPLPAQMAQYGANPYGVGSPGPGTPLGSAAQRRGAPSRLQNVAYGTPGASPGLGQMGQNPNLALLAQQQQQQHQMHQHQMRLAMQAQALSAQQAVNQNQQLQQLQQQQLHQQQQQHGNKRKRQEEQSPAPTIEEESGEAEDLTPYCFCHRPSFGEMIGCDAPDCKIEWFHLNCVGLKTTPEGSWFCSQCEPKMKAQQQRSRRK
ncbi:uncharacterized protein JCM15063_003508 [Sporobolomyces koalae]|uniref:uncharacterized protein n=1 Tax=Sporobolomyces koalae TaxID=500713 RepID=UPI00317F9DF8